MADLLETTENGITTLTLNRPERLNALSPAMTSGLKEALERLSTDRDCGAIVITGAGRGWCAGGDVKTMESRGRDQTVEDRVEGLRHAHQLPLLLRTIPKVVIASINGPVAGAGLGLASTTDSLSELYLFVGIMGGIGTSGFYVIASSTITRWFDRQRSLVLALVLSGFNVSFIIAGPVAAGLIEWLGWRNTFLVFGSWLCLVGGLATLVVRDPPRRVISPATASKAEPRGVTIVAALGDVGSGSSRRAGFCSAGLS